MGRTRVGNGGIAGVVKSIVDDIKKGHWEQVVGPEVAEVVTSDLGADCNETKLHE